jgi:hypothetical protein
MLINYIQPCGSVGCLTYEFGAEPMRKSFSWQRRVGQGRDRAGGLCIIFEGVGNLKGYCSLYYRDPTGDAYVTRMYPEVSKTVKELKSNIGTPEGLEAWVYKMLEKEDAGC